MLVGVPRGSCGGAEHFQRFLWTGRVPLGFFRALAGQVLSRDCLGLLGLKGEVSGERCGVSFAAWGLRDEVRGLHCDEGVSCVMCPV